MADDIIASGSGSTVPPSEGTEQTSGAAVNHAAQLAASVLAELELVHARAQRTEEQQHLYDGWICRRKWSHWESEVPDYSMTTMAWKGNAVRFEPKLEPREGDGVIILLPNGEAFFREFGFGLDDRGELTGILEARATGGEHYRAFYSNTDQFIVLGVLTAVYGRWSDA